MATLDTKTNPGASREDGARLGSKGKVEDYKDIFDVGDFLGSGCTGRVQFATRRSSKDKVALKIFSDTDAGHIVLLNLLAPSWLART